MSSSAPTTEIAVLTLKPDTPIEDISTPAGQIFNQMLNSIQSQSGFQRQYWGRQLENPNHLVFSIDWDSISSHRSWMSSPSYRQFASDISPLLDLSSSNIIHLDFQPHPPDTPRSAPVTEFAFFALPASASASQKSALEAAVTDLADLCVGKTEGGEAAGGEEGGEKRPCATGYATGWVVEPMEHHAGTDEAAISLGAMVGWASKDDHTAVRQSHAFAQKVQPVREMVLPAEKTRAMYFVAFTRWAAGKGVEV
ncbi:hypothetical protein GJ744_012066 [Endocarpon pusillum]|uniref:ABM domain-containing protein n=1 Tax=Endocarpon pusillum TaxID=364733 RepID=A0A8H7ACC5_9EURO|nr:hypothetical protein GJ744_012066 [Endocarpon pusillum]